MNKHKSLVPYLSALIAATIFGFSFLFTKSALDSLGTFQMLGMRFLTAAVFVSLLRVFRLIKIRFSTAIFKDLVMVALFQPVLYFIFETIGVRLTSASESGIIISLVTVSITVIAFFMLKESLTLIQWASISLSVAGVVVITLAKGNASGSGHMTGILALLGAVVAAGFYNSLSRRASTLYTPVEITFVMMWTGAIIFSLLGLLESAASGGMGGYIRALSDPVVLKDILYLGILSSVGAFFLLNYSLSRMEASRLAVFMNLTPVIAVASGICIRGEKFYPLQFVGAALVLAGIWGTDHRSKKSRISVENP